MVNKKRPLTIWMLMMTMNSLHDDDDHEGDDDDDGAEDEVAW